MLEVAGDPLPDPSKVVSKIAVVTHDIQSWRKPLRTPLRSPF
jgi:hypothetical protein